jgi:hypothetical protein
MTASTRVSTTQRRLLLQVEAAAYVGVGPNKFRDLVERGLMPPPKLIDGARRWDVMALDVYVSALPDDTRGSAQRAPGVDRNGRQPGFGWK